MGTRNDMYSIACLWAQLHKAANSGTTLSSEDTQNYKDCARALRTRWKDVTFHAAVEISREIIRPYVRADMTPTLRQVYYRFVALGLAPNSDKTYTKIGKFLAAARAQNVLPLEWIEDRTRDPRSTLAGIQDGVESAIEAIINEAAGGPASYIWMHRWHRQPVLVSVWVEKEALASVFERACKPLGVGLFVCRGYPSVSSIGAWARDMSEHVDSLEDDGIMVDEVRVLYFGDHDPDGLQIPVSAESRLEQMAYVHGMTVGTSVPVVFDNVAITPKQARALEAPPMPAKRSSSRFKKYFERTGMTDAWELDAIPPDDLDRMIRDAVDSHFDYGIHSEVQDEIRELRDECAERLKSPEFLTKLSAKLAGT